ncbi:hypothetical protein ABZW18_15980 [Streptomyces sp. NPDC004647]|uniref:hypothetical protein n=1 Tax=Streptomyces sp. NPDC004647 TaxID=3154671 RepID=UPI0033B8F06C
MTGRNNNRPQGRDRLSLLPTSPVPTEQFVLRGPTEQGVATAVATVRGAPGDQRFTATVAAATEGDPAVLCDVSRLPDQGREPVAARLPELRTITAVGDHATRSLNGLPAEAIGLRGIPVEPAGGDGTRAHRAAGKADEAGGPHPAPGVDHALGRRTVHDLREQAHRGAATEQYLPKLRITGRNVPCVLMRNIGERPSDAS